MEDVEVIESEGGMMMMSGPATGGGEALLEQVPSPESGAEGAQGGSPTEGGVEGVSVAFASDAGSTAEMTLVDPSDFESGGTLDYVDASSNTASLVLVDVQDVTEDLAALTFEDEFGNEGVALASRGGGTTVTTPLWYCYDANGNVGQVIDPTTGAIQAAYEYGPYGTRVVGGGAYWGVNPFRFSTKYADDETGDANVENYLYYYGYRYYSPRLGRWVSRDPMGDSASLNLYTFISNTPTVAIDPLGLWDIELRFAAFINRRLGTWIEEPYIGPVTGWEYKTDERDFGVWNGSSRLWTNIGVNTLALGIMKSRHPAHMRVLTDTGTSIRRRWSILANAVTGLETARGASGHDYDVINVGPCHSRIVVQAWGAYPFTPQFTTPNIDYEVAWDVKVVGRGLVSVKVLTGRHNVFPDYEALVNGKGGSSLQYKYETSWGGPGFSTLSASVVFGDTWFAFGAAHADFDPIPKLIGARTPPCCP